LVGQGDRRDDLDRPGRARHRPRHGPPQRLAPALAPGARGVRRLDPIIPATGAAGAEPAVRVRGVRKVFSSPGGDVVALDGVALHVAPGELVCLLGPSGCGKSTLLNAVAGFSPPTAGTVVANGRPVDGPGPDRAMVFQEYALFPWMTVERNVAFGLE